MASQTGPKKPFLWTETCLILFLRDRSFSQYPQAFVCPVGVAIKSKDRWLGTFVQARLGQFIILEVYEKITTFISDHLLFSGVFG